jgi:hypothetical protein
MLKKNFLPLKQRISRLASGKTGELLKNAWRISPEIRPDVHEVSIKGKSTWFSFITDIDSVGFLLKPGEVYSFNVVYGKDSALTEIRGIEYVPPAVFDETYRRTHDKKTFTEVPEVYELVNIVIALAPQYAQNQQWAVERGTNYYKDVESHFSRYAKEPLVLQFDTLLNNGMYAHLKMDSYAFEFNKKDRIVQSNVYDRVAWGTTNSVRSFLPQLQAFADKTQFRRFYDVHRPFYNDQIKVYRDSVKTAEMVGWLNKNFPTTRYNSFKIIWSPLVNGNQSANWFESNGFRESHAHVNFPYRHWFVKGSTENINLRRGNIVFTEINHAFINPEADKYQEEIVKAFANNKYKWVKKGSPGDGYGMDMAIFNEYMNWGLVSLRYVDYAPKDELDTLLRQNEEYMGENGRGFVRFPEYNRFLVNLYRSRKDGETVADLYPKIVAWFKEKSL